MTEKEILVSIRKREIKTTLKVLNAFPKDKSDYKPHEVSRTAMQIAQTFYTEDLINRQSMQGKVDFSTMLKNMPASWGEIITTF